MTQTTLLCGNMTHMNRRALLKAGVIGIGSSTLAGCIGTGDDPSGDFPTEDIRWIVPYGPGGGFDTYSRGLAEFMPNHLPNDVDIIVENVEGAGGQTGAIEMWRSDPDGYTIGIWNVPGMITQQLVADTEYDLTEVSWIGRISTESYMMGVGADTPYESLDDLRNADEPVQFSQTAPGATGYLVDVVAAEVLDYEYHHVMGFEGSAAQVGGVLRGDAEAVTTIFQVIQPAVEDGEIRPIVVLAEEAPSFAADTPTVVDLGYDELTDLRLQNPVGGPPGIDDEVVEVLESAMISAANSDEMQEWAENNEVPIEPANSQETAQGVIDAVDLFDEYQDLLED